MLSKEEIKKWILENCRDEEGRIDLSELDFSDVKADVDVSCMKVNGDLFQNRQTVKGNIEQYRQTVNGYVNQSSNIAGGSIYQDIQVCDGYIVQDGQWCSRAIYSGRTEISTIEEEVRRKQDLKQHLENTFYDFKE